MHINLPYSNSMVQILYLYFNVSSSACIDVLADSGLNARNTADCSSASAVKTHCAGNGTACVCVCGFHAGKCVCGFHDAED